MKNATHHADILKSVHKKLVKEHKPQPRQALDPVVALVRGVLSWDVPDNKVEEAMKVIQKEFVDLNELRVATELEVQELLGVRYPDVEQRAAMLAAGLNSIFEREHTMHLQRLREISKREARQFLRETPTINPFAEAYVMLYGFEAPCFPMDDTIRERLVDEEVLEEEVSLEDAQKFVEQHVKADDVYDLYSVLRASVFADGKGKRRK